jgi:hypothetical protein
MCEFVTGDGLEAAGSPRHSASTSNTTGTTKKANNRSINPPQIKLTLVLMFLFTYCHLYILSLTDLLEREEWDKETPELTDEEAMRLLEQGEQETPLVPPPQGGGGENDAEMDADAASADNTGGSGSAGTGPRHTAGGNRETSRKEKRRSVSPSESTMSKRTRNDSVSSASTSRTSSFLPPLYYSTLNKREDAITPRVLGGGWLILLLRGV